MRLSNQDVTTIKNTIGSLVDNPKIILFGSRVDDSKKGGDIDLLIESACEIDLQTQIKILAKLELAGIERKVDLLVSTPQTPMLDIYKTAKEKGVLL
jgi:predicted nucleotidyltransferase